MTVQELQNLVKQGKLKWVVTSLARGYVSRKTDGYISEYNGRYGRGYTHSKPNWNSTSYYYISYYVWVD